MFTLLQSTHRQYPDVPNCVFEVSVLYTTVYVLNVFYNDHPQNYELCVNQLNTLFHRIIETRNLEDKDL